MARLRGSWRLSLSIAALSGNPTRLLQPETVSIAHHEAGHAVAGAYFGRPLRYVQTGAHPHCAYTPGTGERSERALMVCTLAGPVASASHERRILCHDPDVIAYHLTKARQGEAGRCDECHAAALLVALYPEEDDTALAHRWRAHVHDTADLLDRLDVRAAVSRVAKALHERVHLSGDQAAVLLDGATLRAGDAVFGPEDEALGDPPRT